MNAAGSCRGIAVARVLVVIAIVAIVSTVALPISRDHLDSTHVTQAIADIGAIEIAISRYQAQNRGELPGTLADLSLSAEQWRDPWGSAYQYRNLEVDTAPDQARTDYDRGTVNRDYDLYSMGKDGRSALTFGSPLARDDVVRGLSGSYYGSVAEYPRASGRP
jgi:general secretion pathway protein G